MESPDKAGKNYFEVSSDNELVYYVAKMKRRRSVVFVFRLLIAVLAIGLLGRIAFKDLGFVYPEWAFALLIASAFSGLFLLFFGVVFLWNIYGEESLVISTKGITVQNNYGWWQTAPKKYAFSEGVRWYFSRNNPSKEEGILVFETYDELGQPVPLIQSAILVPRLAHEELTRHLEVLFERERLGQLSHWN